MLKRIICLLSAVMVCASSCFAWNAQSFTGWFSNTDDIDVIDDIGIDFSLPVEGGISLMSASNDAGQSLSLSDAVVSTAMNSYYCIQYLNSVNMRESYVHTFTPFSFDGFD